MAAIFALVVVMFSVGASARTYTHSPKNLLSATRGGKMAGRAANENPIPMADGVFVTGEALSDGAGGSPAETRRARFQRPVITVPPWMQKKPDGLG